MSICSLGAKVLHGPRACSYATNVLSGISGRPEGLTFAFPTPKGLVIC